MDNIEELKKYASLVIKEGVTSSTASGLLKQASNMQLVANLMVSTAESKKLGESRYSTR